MKSQQVFVVPVGRPVRDMLAEAERLAFAGESGNSTKPGATGVPAGTWIRSNHNSRIYAADST